MRFLILMRHAKAVRDHEAASDIERGLNARGREEARRAGRLLREAGLIPSRTLVSSARRTRETVLAFEEPPTDIRYDDDLYLASAPALQKAAERAADTDTLLLIGHNPGLKDLAARFIESADGHNALAVERLADGLPTSWCCVFAVAGKPTPGRTRLVSLLAPERTDG